MKILVLNTDIIGAVIWDFLWSLEVVDDSVGFSFMVWFY